MALQAWVGRTGAQLDADSPLDITLHNSYDDDLIHLKQVLYGDGAGGFRTPIDGHNHDGSNSTIIKNASINKVFGAYTTHALAAGASWTPSATIHMTASIQLVKPSIWNGSIWIDSFTEAAGAIIFDGTNLKIINQNVGGVNYQYRELD